MKSLWGAIIGAVVCVILAFQAGAVLGVVAPPSTHCFGRPTLRDYIEDGVTFYGTCFAFPAAVIGTVVGAVMGMKLSKGSGESQVQHVPGWTTQPDPDDVEMSSAIITFEDGIRHRR